MRDCGGHRFPPEQYKSPRHFEIWYENKGKRVPNQPDRKCQACGLSVEIKKRNKDQRFRVSHSKKRPFFSEHPHNGWHAFVFADMEPRFVRNADIAKAIATRRCRSDHDQYDRWADIEPDAVKVEDPPRCPQASAEKT